MRQKTAADASYATHTSCLQELARLGVNRVGVVKQAIGERDKICTGTEHDTTHCTLTARDPLTLAHSIRHSHARTQTHRRHSQGGIAHCNVIENGNNDLIDPQRRGS